MSNSVIGKGHYGFEAALISTGLLPTRDIREERRIREAKAKHATQLAFERRRKYLEEFEKEHGEDLSSYNARKRKEEWEELVGEEPVFDSDVIKWKDEVGTAAAILRFRGEDYGLPENNNGYFSYWIRRELLTMRGTRSQFSSSRKHNFLQHVEKV